MLKKLLALALPLLAAAAFAASADANKATQAELESVKGIGPGISTSIIEERKKAPFKDWQDLTGRVKGLGPKKAEALSRRGLTVDGASYGNATAKAADAAASRPTRK